jgi:hypothetical protein
MESPSAFVLGLGKGTGALITGVASGVLTSAATIVGKSFYMPSHSKALYLYCLFNPTLLCHMPYAIYLYCLSFIPILLINIPPICHIHIHIHIHTYAHTHIPLSATYTYTYTYTHTHTHTHTHTIVGTATSGVSSVASGVAGLGGDDKFLRRR